VSVFHSRTVPSSLALGQPVPVGAERHVPHRASVAGDDLEGAGPLHHRAVERAFVRGRGEGAGGQDLLERSRVPARLGAGQHALRLGDQLLRGRGPQIGFRLVLGVVGRPSENHGYDGRDEGYYSDDHRCGQHGAQDAGAAA